MLHSSDTPKMTREDAKRFREGIVRRMRGNFTDKEVELHRSSRQVYRQFIESNGGKNPLFG